jgi:uncharacterized membrane protein YfcA
MTLSLADSLGLIGLGFVVGAYGTMIGAGGGFLLVPALLILYPTESPADVTAVSLAVVFANAYSGAWSYARMGRIDYPAGLLFVVAGVPGAVIGTRLVMLMPRESFEFWFGLVLLLLGVFLAWRPVRAGTKSAPAAIQPGEWRDRSMVGAIGSAYVGLFGSLLGIGGGILHVPFLIRVLRFPPHVATATSHFVLAFVSFAGVVSHLVAGDLTALLAPTAFLSLGVMLGAPMGATFSSLVPGTLLVRLLAAAIIVVAVRLLW